MTHRRLLLLLLLPACDAHESTETLPIETASDDRLSIGPAVDDMLAMMPDCPTTTGDGRLDLDEGCADGLCGKISYVDLKLQAPNLECHAIRNGLISCNVDGVGFQFTDTDGDGTPDEDDTSLVHLRDGWSGSTSSGIGLGSPMSCFIDILGEPDFLDFSRVGDEYVVYKMSFDGNSIQVSDRREDPTGLARRVAMGVSQTD